jgi:hypothetical protein
MDHREFLKRWNAAWEAAFALYLAAFAAILLVAISPIPLSSVVTSRTFGP